MNQQRTPDSTSIFLNEQNIDEIELQCQYRSEDSFTMYGFATVYRNLTTNQVNAVFADWSGNIININLDTCVPNWVINIQQALDENEPYVTRNGLTLFRLSDGTEGIVFGTPNGFGSPNTNKYVAALHLDTGELMWKLSLGNSAKEAFGSVHAAVVDGDSVYVNMASGCQLIENKEFCKFIGRVHKITMSATYAILDAVWFTIPFDLQPSDSQSFDRNYYQGAGVWNWPALIDNYFVFGSGNLYTMPDYVVDCMMNGNPTYETYSIDPCGIDQSNSYVQWKCLQDRVYASSFNILNKNTFFHINSVRLSGTDVYSHTQDGSCILDAVPFDFVPWSPECYAVEYSGADADLAAISAYNVPGTPPQQRVAGVSKAGMFYVFEIPSGNVLISKKYGPWSSLGGGHFSFAVSEEYQIGVAHISGGTQVYGNLLADGNVYCGGVIHGIDLNTGETLYQIPNPWALINEGCMEQVINPENGATRELYQDYSTINSDICTRIGYENENPNVINIDISEYIDDEVTRDVENRASFFAPVSIANRLLFIPSATGDIFVNDVVTGESIHILRCNWEPIIGEIGGRRGIRAGATVIEDRVIYFCGDASNALMSAETIMYSWRLPIQYRSK